METDAPSAAITSDWLAWIPGLLSFFGLSGLSGLGDLAARLWSQSSAIISVLVLAWLIYKGYKALEAAGSLELLRGVFSIGLLYFVSHLLRLEFLVWLLDRILPTLLIFMAIILQPELRRIFVQIGRQIHMSQRQGLDARVIEDTLGACEQLADMGRGALIVFRRENSLRHILHTGTLLNSSCSVKLLVSIFAYDTPLHDGATVLADSKIIAGGCILPIDLEDLPGNMDMGSPSFSAMGIGTRHHAALKLARETDAVVVVVSEETSNISLVYDAQMRSQMSSAEMVQKLCELLTDEVASQNRVVAWLQKILLGQSKPKPMPKPEPKPVASKAVATSISNNATSQMASQVASKAASKAANTIAEELANPKAQEAQEVQARVQPFELDKQLDKKFDKRLAKKFEEHQ